MSMARPLFGRGLRGRACGSDSMFKQEAALQGVTFSQLDPTILGRGCTVSPLLRGRRAAIAAVSKHPIILRIDEDRDESVSAHGR